MDLIHTIPSFVVSIGCFFLDFKKKPGYLKMVKDPEVAKKYTNLVKIIGLTSSTAEAVKLHAMS